MPLIDASQIYQMTNVGDHIDGTDVYQSNPNLLDNHYFVGGGSQLGDGIFPINQRGLTTYTGGGTNLDRWKTWDGSDVITLTSNGVQFISPSGNGMFQYFPVFPTEKTVTFSAIINGDLYSVTLPEGDTQYEHWETGFGIGISRNGKCVYINSQNTTLLIAACKLEIGTVSTLVYDAPPDFGEELRKCQRYLYVLNVPAYHFLGEVALAGDATNCTIGFHTPAEMRTTAPSIVLTSGLWVGGAQTTAVNWTRTIGTTVVAACTVTGGLSGSTLYAVATGASATTITISAEL